MSKKGHVGGGDGQVTTLPLLHEATLSLISVAPTPNTPHTFPGLPEVPGPPFPIEATGIILVSNIASIAGNKSLP